MATTKGVYAEVKRRIDEQTPDLSRLLTYRQIAEQYGERFAALGLPADPERISGTLRSLTSRRVLHRYYQGLDVKVPANEVETYLAVLEEPRPVA